MLVGAVGALLGTVGMFVGASVVGMLVGAVGALLGTVGMFVGRVGALVGAVGAWLGTVGASVQMHSGQEGAPVGEVEGEAVVGAVGAIVATVGVMVPTVGVMVPKLAHASELSPVATTNVVESVSSPSPS
jgi:hypothetical protein